MSAPGRPRDERSVGELLLDSEIAARDILMDPHEVDAATMLRTWGEVVESAGDVWQALPQPGPGSDEVMSQLVSMSGTLARSSRNRTWPGEGPADERLLRIAENLTRAADMLTRYQPRATSPEIRADLAAAQARLVHTLYVGVHGVNVALSRELRDLQTRQARRYLAPTEERPTMGHLRAVSAARDRVAAFEALAGAYVSKTYPADLASEHRTPPAPERLRHSLARWDVQAHRTLAGGNAAEILLASQTQAVIAQGAIVLARAAAERGAIDPDLHRSRIAPALDGAHASWSALAGSWTGLLPPAARTGADPLLCAAAQEVRAAMHEVTHDRATLATAQVIAERTALSKVPQLVRQWTASSVDLAHVVRDATLSPDLTAPARAVNERGRQLVDDGGGPGGGWVAAVDHRYNRPTPLPDEVRQDLLVRNERVTEAARVGMSAAASLGGPQRQQPAENTSSIGRQQADRAAPSLSPATTAPIRR